MRRLLSILAVAVILGALPANLWAQANLPNNPNAQTIQGPDSSGLMGYPLAVVGAPGGTAVNVSGAGGTFTFVNGVESTVNQTQTPLLANQTFTGAYENVSDFSSLEVYIDGTVGAPSAFHGVEIDWSFDGVNTDFKDLASSGTITPTQQSLDFPIRSHFVRYRYTNGAVNQTFFKSGFVYRRTAKQVVFPSFFRPGDGTYQPFQANTTVTILGIASHNTAQQVIGLANPNYRGAEFFLHVTAVPAVPGSGGLDLQLLAEDPSGNLTVLNQARTSRIQAIGDYAWILYPGSAGTSAGMGIQQILAQPLPSLYGAKITVGDAQSYTYQLTAELIQ